MGASKKHKVKRTKEAVNIHTVKSEHSTLTTEEAMDGHSESSQYGICRCCLEMGTFKPIHCGDAGAQTGSCMEMLHATFSITLAQLRGDTSHSDVLICDTCEMRLGDAHTFKQQVLEAQGSYEQYLRKRLIEVHIERLNVDSAKMEKEFEIHIAEECSDIDDLCENVFSRTRQEQPDDKAKASVKSEAGKNYVKIRKNKKSCKNYTKKQGDRESCRKSNKTQPKAINLECDFCQIKIPPMYSDFVDHMQTEHSLGAFKRLDFRETSECDICKRSFSTCRQRAVHVTNSHLTCLKCLKVFRNIYERDDHKQTHPARCRLCKEVFPTKKLLESHKIDAHNYRCLTCTEHFDNDKALMKHKITAHGEPKHECGACSKSFYFRAHLTKHQRKDHLMERNISCAECDYTAYDKWQLNKHMVRHSNVKEHECGYCKKKFARANTLRYHTRIHTGDKRQVCQLCGAAFVQRASLKYHLEKYHPEQL